MTVLRIDHVIISHYFTGECHIAVGQCFERTHDLLLD
jgi:hypothetical protein